MFYLIKLISSCLLFSWNSYLRFAISFGSPGSENIERGMCSSSEGITPSSLHASILLGEFIIIPSVSSSELTTCSFSLGWFDLFKAGLGSVISLISIFCSGVFTFWTSWIWTTCFGGSTSWISSCSSTSSSSSSSISSISSFSSDSSLLCSSIISSGFASITGSGLWGLNDN